MDLLSYVKERANLSSLMLGAGTVMAGSACAALRGNQEWLSASLCLLFAIFCQVGANLGYYYYRLKRDYDKTPHPRYERKADKMNEIESRILREGSFAAFLLAAMVGLTIMSTSAKPVGVVTGGEIIVGLIALMNHSKKPIFGTLWALVFTWLLFGPVGVIMTSFVEVQLISHDAWVFFDHAPSLFVGPAMGFLACNVHLMYSYMIYRITPDARGGATYSLTPRGLQVLMFVNGLLTLAIMFFGAFWFNFLKPMFSLVPTFLSFSLNTFIAFRMGRAPVGELSYLNMLCKFNFFLMGLTLLIFWYFLGFPSASMIELI